VKNDRKDAIWRESPDIERELGRLAADPTPPGLRQRVLDAARGARKDAALTPRLRTLAAVCGLVIAAVLAIDPLVVRHETARLAALFDGPSSARTAVNEAAELAELLDGHEGKTRWISRLQVMAASAVRSERKDNFIEARARLKGWIEHETSENIN
jgi:hypothetical protein